MKCQKCGCRMVPKKGVTPEGFEYDYNQCHKCSEATVDMRQLHTVTQKYREMKKYSAKISRWGGSLVMRFPKELAEQYCLKQNNEVTLAPEKKAIRIISG